VSAVAPVAQLRLKGVPLGWVQAVLFDKDGTMSHSEPRLIALAEARIQACLSQVSSGHRARLRDLLEGAYGARDGRIDPAGITAVASRMHNLIATATAFAQVGLGWPEALNRSEILFDSTDAAAGSEPAAAQTTEGLAPLLIELDRAGVVLGVISNDQTRGIEQFLSAHGLERHIRGIWSADHQPAKPNPMAVHHFCAQLGVDPATCALIGDADSDLAMAVAAGLPHALGYTAGWATKPRLAGQHLLIDHWSELTVHAADPANPA